MSSTAPDFAYISCDLPEQVTLREYGRDLAARRTPAEGRLRRAAHGLHLGHPLPRRPRPASSLRLA